MAGKGAAKGRHGGRPYILINFMMIDDNEIQRRRSLRLKGYDYAQPGYYYITICAQNRECLFGDITNSHMHLNDPGKIINRIWKEIPQFYKGIGIDEYVIMPNHIHGIIIIENGNPIGQAQGPAPTITLPDLIKRYKTLTTRKYIDGVRSNSWKPFKKRLWQRNYYEHIIRNDIELDEIRKYITDNPAKWAEDKDNSANIKH